METKVLNNFRKSCRTIYQYYRVQIINQTPFLHPNLVVLNFHFERYFICVERAWKEMNTIANNILNNNPQLQDALNDIIQSYLTRYNMISKALRRRYTFDI